MSRGTRRRPRSQVPALLAGALLAPDGALAGSLAVTSGADAGPGSFRAAVEAASLDPTVDTLRFEPALRVVLESPVVYTGEQPLRIRGRGAQIAGSPGATPAPRWDAGLFASRSAASLRLDELRFVDSFNNGIGIFVPAEASGSVELRLDRVSIEKSRFHGLYIDGQHTDTYDTDGVPHTQCLDPHPVDSDAGISLRIRSSDVIGNGTLAGGFDTGAPLPGGAGLGGCPADFDGIRVDEGGPGGIRASLRDVWVEGNLADGVEYDERGEGDVVARTVETTIRANGETGTADPDDGFDIDEAEAGDLVARFDSVRVVDNRDEGLDLDEAGPGSARVRMVRSIASRNENQAVEIDEEDDGDLALVIVESRIQGSGSQGVELTEAGPGELDARIVESRVNGNTGAGVAAAQQAPGTGRLRLRYSDLGGNAEGPTSLEGVERMVGRD